ncbi:MAG: hypothetical protein QOF14_314 [Hyphomicrobiales bacterium]|jgi:hypothetical protein|nr:hypothetical protein [Hyphomicrobiales bacterium]
MAEGDPNELLPEADREFLTDSGYDFSVKQINEQVHVVLHNFPLPKYQPPQADLLAILPNGYPNGNPDMFWTSPDVKLPSGAFPLRAEVHETYAERKWQRWSRHFDKGKWRAGIDNLRSYLTSVRAELAKGV